MEKGKIINKLFLQMMISSFIEKLSMDIERKKVFFLLFCEGISNHVI